MDSGVVGRVEGLLCEKGILFGRKPILIGGAAMEYYGLRKAGKDIDLLIAGEDYEALAKAHPKERKDIYGDCGVVLWPFEIWRSMTWMDYDFYKEGATEHESLLVTSIDRLLLMRVIARKVPKYEKDLELVEQYYYAKHTNLAFKEEAQKHWKSYEANGGTVFGGQYGD